MRTSPAPNGRWTQPPHPEAVETEYRRLVELAFQDDVERQRGIRSLKVIVGDPALPYVAFTFDDGPHGAKSLELLQILRRLSLPATFFLVGQQIRRYPAIVERMALEGHEIGNHTYHHYRLPQIPLDEVAPELNSTRDLLESMFGVRTRLVRPPGGEYNTAVQRVIEANNYANILWSADPADYKIGRTAARIEQLVLRDITPGGIVLLHDGIPATYAALPRIVTQVRARGLIPVTVSELIRRGGGLLRVRDIRVSQTCAT
ncbi:MAG: polysaccharide deacetylase family protein [Capsulimonadales bacterium]|nr:polysaccharide deacetylase family protein [Capsulimonadales bacterium]